MQQLSAKVRGEIGRNVYGEGAQGAVYYHGGHYYDAAGEYLYSNPETSPPPGVTSGPQESSGAGETGGNPVGREAQLMQLNVTQLQKLQRGAGVLEDNIIKGEGAKAKLIVWLLENTRD